MTTKFMITVIGFAVICITVLSQLTTVEAALAETTSSAQSFSDAILTDVTYPGQGWLMVASIQVSSGDDDTYGIRWQGSEFECAIAGQPSNQLLCNIPLLPAWNQTTFDVYHLGSEAVIFQIDCVRIDFGDDSEISSSPELACQIVH